MILGILVIVASLGLIALEFYVYDRGLWWHEDEHPKDPRNGL